MVARTANTSRTFHSIVAHQPLRDDLEARHHVVALVADEHIDANTGDHRQQQDPQP
jgi:hypothetical protein